MRSIAILCMLTLSFLIGKADDGTLKIQGKTFLLDLESQKKKTAPEISIQVYSGSELIQEVKSAKHGRYSIELPFNDKYRVVFGGDAYISKIVEINAYGFHKDVMESGYKMSMDMTVITDDGYRTCDIRDESIQKEVQEVTWDLEQIEKGG